MYYFSLESDGQVVDGAMALGEENGAETALLITESGSSAAKPITTVTISVMMDCGHPHSTSPSRRTTCPPPPDPEGVGGGFPNICHLQTCV